MKYFVGIVCLLNTNQQNFILLIFCPSLYIGAELLKLSTSKKSAEYGLPVTRSNDFITWCCKYFRRGLQCICMFVGVFRENFAVLRMENCKVSMRISNSLYGTEPYSVSADWEIVFFCIPKVHRNVTGVTTGWHTERVRFSSVLAIIS